MAKELRIIDMLKRCVWESEDEEMEFEAAYMMIISCKPRIREK